MRIGIDMLAVQAPGSRGRGVGRFGWNLVRALLGQGRNDQFVLYAHAGLPIDQFPSAPHALLTMIEPDPERGESKIRDAIEWIARTNPHGLDAILVLNPFELFPYYDPP